MRRTGRRSSAAGDEAVAAAQTALRLGARRVTLVCETTRERMSCFSEWVDAAEAEGIKLELSAKLVRSEADRRRGGARDVRARRRDIRASTPGRLIAAPQRRADTEFFKKLGLNVSARGIAADRQTLATNLDGVFAGGECVAGPGAAVRAVAAGRLAALSIGQFLRGEPVVGRAQDVHVLMGKLSDSEHAALFRDFVRGERRAEGDSLDAARRRTTFDEITGRALRCRSRPRSAALHSVRLPGAGHVRASAVRDGVRGRAGEIQGRAPRLRARRLASGDRVRVGQVHPLRPVRADRGTGRRAAGDHVRGTRLPDRGGDSLRAAGRRRSRPHRRAMRGGVSDRRAGEETANGRRQTGGQWTIDDRRCGHGLSSIVSRPSCSRPLCMVRIVCRLRRLQGINSCASSTSPPARREATAGPARATWRSAAG